MAQTVLSSGTSDFAAVAAGADQELVTLQDRSAGLTSFAAFKYCPILPGSRSLTNSVPVYPLPGGSTHALGDSGEYPSLTAETWITSKQDLTVSQRSKFYDISEEMLSSGSEGGYFRQSVKLAEMGRMFFENKIRSLACTVAATASANVTDSGSPLTWEHLVQADATIGATGQNGQRIVVLHPNQMRDLRIDIGSKIAPIVSEAFKGLLSIANEVGYQGNFNGFEVFVTTSVADSGSDKVGFMAGPDAILWGDLALQSHELINDGELSLMGGKMRVSAKRDLTHTSTQVAFTSLIGAALGVDGAVCKIITQGA